MHLAQQMPLPLTVSCFSKIQIGFTFLVLAHPGGPGKGLLNVCVCVVATVLVAYTFNVIRGLIQDRDGAVDGSAHSDGEAVAVSEAESAWYTWQLGSHCPAERHVLLYWTVWLVFVFFIHVHCIQIEVTQNSQIFITHTHPFNGPFSRTTQVSRYQKGKSNLGFTEASGSGISWSICKSAPRSRQITMPAHHAQFFTGWMPFLPPSQPNQSTEGIIQQSLII